MAAASSSGDTDDLKLVALYHGRNQDDGDATGLSAISDEEYAAELQLQEVIVSSAAMALIVSSAMAATASQSSLTPQLHSAVPTANKDGAAVETPVLAVVESCSSSSSSPPALATPAVGEGTSVMAPTALAGGAVVPTANKDGAAVETPALAVVESCSSSSSPPALATPAAGEGTSVMTPTALAEICKICLDHVLPADAPRASRGCAHAFCAACLDRYIGAKNQDGISDVKCPGEDCCSVLDPELCQGIISRDAFEGWSAALCMSMVIRDSNVCYCPFNDCSEIMVDDRGGGEVTESECPVCRRLFCARCGVPWHAGITCDEYGQLAPEDRGKEDLVVLEMAKGKKWRRCPRCKFWVDKNDGCMHITCRCGFQFCYGCGEPWGQSHHSSCNTGYLPRHQFGSLQGKMFPAYFMFISVCTAISVVAFAYLHPWKTASTIERYQLGFLISALGCNLSNLLVFTPMIVEMMMKRHKMEKDLGIGTEVGYSKNSETAKRSPALAAMNRKFGMIHGLSSLANIMAFGSLAMHSWYLSSKLDL